MSNNTPIGTPGAPKVALEKQNPTQNILVTTQNSMNNIIGMMKNTDGLTPIELFAKLKKEKEEKERMEAEAEVMRQKKFAVLEKYNEFATENIKEHPPLSTIINISDKTSVEQLSTETIIKYVARQNIVCTFYCDEVLTTGTDRVEELAKIFTGKTEGHFVHLTRWTSDRPGFSEEWENKKKNDPNYASQYFLVHLKNEPQNPKELQSFVETFKEIGHNLIKKHDKK